MKASKSRRNRIQDYAENSLLIAVIAGTVIAITTQNMAWGLIPIAIALVFNQFSRRQQQRSQSHQLSHLETLIQSTQSEQENQQILLWQVKQKAEEIESSLQEFQQDTDALKAKTSTLNQVETIVAKQEHLEQKQQKLEEAQSHLESEINNNFSTKQKVEELQHYLKQVTQLLDSLVKFQTEQSQTMATKLSELQMNLDQNPNKPLS